jgi:hypothetical protein
VRRRTETIAPLWDYRPTIWSSIMSGAEIQKDWKRLWLLAGLVAIGWTNPGAAAQAAHSPTRSEAVQHRVETTVTAQNTQVDSTSAIDDGKNCGQSRKRLFVEGEGWIGRRVTTCY